LLERIGECTTAAGVHFGVPKAAAQLDPRAIPGRDLACTESVKVRDRQMLTANGVCRRAAK
jgi:hypothetical protein